MAQKRSQRRIRDVHGSFHLRPDSLPVDTEMKSHHKEHQETEDAVQPMHPERRVDIEKRHRVREGEPRQHDAQEKEEQKQIDTGHDDALLWPAPTKEGTVPPRIPDRVEKKERGKDKG